MENYNFMGFYYFISFYLPYHSIMIVQLTNFIENANTLCAQLNWSLCVF